MVEPMGFEPTTFPGCALQSFDKTEGHRSESGGADGIRTHDLLDAIEARSQLRHGPTASQGQLNFYNIPRRPLQGGMATEQTACFRKSPSQRALN